MTRRWIVCQIGAREHYAIPRALHSTDLLAELVTDFWIRPGSWLSRIPALRRLSERYHSGLAGARVHAPHREMLRHEIHSKLRQRRGWGDILARNATFQSAAIRHLAQGPVTKGERLIMFSYSYAARDLFRFAKSQGWQTVLGQIDPGPEEERLVVEEHARFPELGSRWQPAPVTYWESWREELRLADVVVVNSSWSRDCLVKAGAATEKIKIIPLVYSEHVQSPVPGRQDAHTGATVGREFMNLPSGRPFQVLFLGQINLRKGIGRLLGAMRLLQDQPIQLTLVGPTEIDPQAWADLPNVKWLGPVPRSRVGDYYRQADVFILPSLSDGYALTQLEAMAHGIPVIASKNCGEVVRHGQNGWQLEDLEPRTIRAAILEAAQSRGRVRRAAPLHFGMDQLRDSLHTIGDD